MDNKLNSKGITIIEIIICFSIVCVIVISMFKVVNNYKVKQEIESDRSEIIKYKNTVTKTIMDTFINNNDNFRIEIMEEVNEVENDPESGKNINYSVNTVNVYSSDSYYKYELKIKKSHEENQNISKDQIGFKICENSNHGYMDNFNDTDEFKLPKINGLKFNDVYVKQDDYFLYVRVGLSHPDLGNAYDALNLIIPIKEFKL